MTGSRELERDPESLDRRSACTKHSHPRERRAHASELVVVLPGLHRDVITEPLRLLMGVCMASNVNQKSGVVDGRPLLGAESELLRDPQGDQTLPQHVLHRLAEAEIDTQRKGSDELSKADTWRSFAHMHEVSVPSPDAAGALPDAS